MKWSSIKLYLLLLIMKLKYTKKIFRFNKQKLKIKRTKQLIDEFIEMSLIPNPIPNPNSILNIIYY